MSKDKDMSTCSRQLEATVFNILLNIFRCAGKMSTKTPHFAEWDVYLSVLSGTPFINKQTCPISCNDG